MEDSIMFNGSACLKRCGLFVLSLSVVSISVLAQMGPGNPGNPNMPGMPGGPLNQDEPGSGISDEELQGIREIIVNETPVEVPMMPAEGIEIRFKTEFSGIYRIKTFAHAETPVDTVINLVQSNGPDRRPDFIAFNDDVQEGDLTSELNRNLPEGHDFIVLIEPFDEDSAGKPFLFQVEGPLNYSVFPNGRVIRHYNFSEDTLQDAGLVNLPGGFGGGRSGQVSIIDFQPDAFPNSDDDRGLSISVDQNDVSFLFIQEPIFSNGQPISIRLRYRASNESAALFLAALRGSLRDNADLDGSITLNQANSLSDAVDSPKVLELIYRKPRGVQITPLIQVAGSNPRGGTEILIDEMVIFELDSNGIF
jgi:hypothetical protein